MGSLRTLIERASDWSESLFDPADVMMPHYVAEAADGSITIFAMAVGGRDLDQYRALMQIKFSSEGYSRWVFFAESWAVEYDKGETSHFEPKDHPNRMEVVQFTGLDARGNRSLRASRQICRLPGGTGRLLPLVFRRVPCFDVPTTTVAQGS